ncbi:MAG: hypothetical protein AB7O97_15875 [Planctomycetota bacterium]
MSEPASTPAEAPATAAARPAADRIHSLRLARLARRLTLPLALVLGAALFWCFGAIRVPAGMDTLPEIPPGSLCILDRRDGRLQPGMAVFVDLPDGSTLLSRIEAVDDEGRLIVRNDNARSRLPDSAAFGALPRSAARGVVLVVFPGDGPRGEAFDGR